MLSSSCSKKSDSSNTPTATTVSDADGYVYHTVTIGAQVWMVENLKTTKYNDGTAIPLVTDSTAWAILTIPGYCWYNNDAVTYKATYGALYNWYAVNTGKLAPKGWHVPADAEWTKLITFLGGEDVAGGKMKSTGTIKLAMVYGITPIPTQPTKMDLQLFRQVNVDSMVLSSALATTATFGVHLTTI